MKAFNNEQVPVAKRGNVVRLEPEGTLRRVEAVEQLPVIGPVDLGSVSSGGTATRDGSNEIEITELEMRQNQLSQVWVHPIAPVEIEVAQDGQQDWRFETAQERGTIEAGLPAQFRELYVLNDDVPYFLVTNPNSYDLQTCRIAFSGWKFELQAGELDEAPVDEQPISVPIERLERSTQGTGTRGTQQRDESAGMSATRAQRRQR